MLGPHATLTDTSTRRIRRAEQTPALGADWLFDLDIAR